MGTENKTKINRLVNQWTIGAPSATSYLGSSGFSGDLLVVSPRFDDQRSREDINLLWRLAAQTDNRIEPIPCGEQQWFEDDASAIIEIARREGETVTIS